MMYRNETDNFKIRPVCGELRAVFQLAEPTMLKVDGHKVLAREISFNQRALGEKIVDSINKGQDHSALSLAFRALDKANRDNIRQASRVGYALLNLIGFPVTETVFVNKQAVAEKKAARQQTANSQGPQP